MGDTIPIQFKYNGDCFYPFARKQQQFTMPSSQHSEISIGIALLPQELEEFLERIESRAEPAHRAEAARFRSEKRRAQFFAGRQLLAALCKYRGLAYSWNSQPAEAEWRAGKGLMTTAEPAVTSVSYGGDRVVAAVAEGVSRIGIDCERADGKGRWKQLAKSFFSEREAAIIAAAPDDEVEGVFLERWVLKEAFLKATGTGIAGGLASIELLQDGSICLQENSGWAFWRGEYQSSFMALAYQTDLPASLEFLEVPLLDAEPELRSLYVLGDQVSI